MHKDQVMRRFSLILMLILVQSIVQASEKMSQKLELTQVSDKVWAIVGPLGNRTAVNFGNNASFGFVVTTKGVVLIDSGGSLKGAQEIDKLIKSVTSQRVKFVINTGGQDHRWLGNDYFKRQGAKIITSKKALKDQHKRFNTQLAQLRYLIGEENIRGTLEQYADISFEDKYKFSIDNVAFELYFEGGAHTKGDIFVWLPQEKIIFAGDIVYMERLLSINVHSNSEKWVHSFEALSRLQPKKIIPGHGKPTTLAQATKETYDYLLNLRNQVEKLDDISEINKIDQSRFSHLYNYELLKGKNAQRVFTEMEWE